MILQKIQIMKIKQILVTLSFLFINTSMFSFNNFERCEEKDLPNYFKRKLYYSISLIQNIDVKKIKYRYNYLTNEEFQLIDSLVCDSINKDLEIGDGTFLDYIEPRLMYKKVYTYVVDQCDYVFINYSVKHTDSKIVGISFDGRPHFFEVIFDLSNKNLVYLK